MNNNESLIKIILHVNYTVKSKISKLSAKLSSKLSKLSDFKIFKNFKTLQLLNSHCAALK